MQSVDRFGHVRPEARSRAGRETGPLADRAHVLAGETAAEHIDLRHLAPLDGGDVAEIRGIGPMVGEDTGDGRVDLREPDRLPAGGVLHSEIEPAVAREQRPDPERAGLRGMVVHEMCSAGHVNPGCRDRITDLDSPG